MEKPDALVIHKIMDRAIEINTACHQLCRNFQIMKSEKHKDILILRWTAIDISDIERPKQTYEYECFEMDGTPQFCSIHYTNQQQANAFFKSLVPLYSQQFAMTHK